MLKNKKVNLKKTKDESLHHASDKGFKVAMKVKESALEFVEKFVPELYVHLDLTTFELDNTNYVSKEFKEYYSDIVYRTYLKSTSTTKKKPVAIALLFEHKKTISSYFLLFLQLLEYIIFIWREDLANKRKPSVIIPIVVFQGKKGLKLKQLHDCFEGIPKEILKHIPNFEFYLTSVHQVPNEKILALEEKGLLRSLFLAYTFYEKRESIENMLSEVFKFIKHRPDRFDFFELLLAFLSKEGYLSSLEIEELFNQYLTPPQKENVMTTYQALKKEGRQEGEVNKARLMILRGKWKGASADFLADMSEMPFAEVEKLLKGYDKAYAFWKNDKKTIVPIAHLTEQEVQYLFDLFDKK
jgi:Putative transposase, YhgA-like